MPGPAVTRLRPWRFLSFINEGMIDAAQASDRHSPFSPRTPYHAPRARRCSVRGLSMNDFVVAEPRIGAHVWEDARLHRSGQAREIILHRVIATELEQSCDLVE